MNKPAVHKAQNPGTPAISKCGIARDVFLTAWEWKYVDCAHCLKMKGKNERLRKDLTWAVEQVLVRSHSAVYYEAKRIKDVLTPKPAKEELG